MFRGVHFIVSLSRLVFRTEDTGKKSESVRTFKKYFIYMAKVPGSAMEASVTMSRKIAVGILVSALAALLGPTIYISQ